MIDFRSGLWVDHKGSFCLWEEERPVETSDEMAYFYDEQDKKWLYAKASSDMVNDYQLTDFHLTSWK